MIKLLLTLTILFGLIFKLSYSGDEIELLPKYSMILCTFFWCFLWGVISFKIATKNTSQADSFFMGIYDLFFKKLVSSVFSILIAYFIILSIFNVVTDKKSQEILFILHKK